MENPMICAYNAAKNVIIDYNLELDEIYDNCEEDHEENYEIEKYNLLGKIEEYTSTKDDSVIFQYNQDKIKIKPIVPYQFTDENIKKVIAFEVNVYMPNFEARESKLSKVVYELAKLGIGTTLGLLIPGAGAITKVIDLMKKKKKQKEIEGAKDQIKDIIIGSFYKELDEDLAISRIKISNKKVRKTKNVFN